MIITRHTVGLEPRGWQGPGQAELKPRRTAQPTAVVMRATKAVTNLIIWERGTGVISNGRHLSGVKRKMPESVASTEKLIAVSNTVR